MSGGATLADGDLNFDGQVDSADFTVLSMQFGSSLPAQTQALSLASSTAPSLFGSKAVTASVSVLEDDR
jgi:hypothetical protein